VGLCAVFGLVLVVGCAAPKPSRADKTVEVDVTNPITDTVLDYQDFTGRLDAFMTVDVRPRVAGYIISAPFKEGDRVKKGDLLFQIDPKLYQADLDLAEATLSLANADRQLQEANSGRARQMIGSRAIGREEYDQIMASRDKTKATTVAMEATLKKASIHLGYTKVTSPISGRISRRAVDPGNLVKADETLLSTVVNDDQIYAYFDIDERTYLNLVAEKLELSPGVMAADLHFPVLMRLANENEFTHPGVVDFVDNRLNGNTGTIRMRARFDNPRGKYKSGLFVRIRLPIGQPDHEALLIADEAIQSDQGKKYVFVVEKNKVQYRSVTLGQAINGLRVIKDGLKKDDLVVVNGMQRVRTNMDVKAKPQTPPKLGDTPLKQLISLVEADAAKPKSSGRAASSPTATTPPPADVHPHKATR
jgi:RND family efflux transporter MFP subunit